MFSSIEEEDRKTVIEQCYWPLLKLAEKEYKLGVELTGLSLEIIMTIDPFWVEKFKILLAEQKIELIGSGYSQIIGPLVPAEVNDWNQKLGLESYQRLLGVTPEIALVNEMAYSAGIVEHYTNNGYRAIVMEWNNPRKYHPEWDNGLRYFAQKVINQDGKGINLIWADSIAFQKFQRYAHGETCLSEYLEYLKIHQSSESRFFPLYASDAEVFDYRPDRFKTEANQSQDVSEWDRIKTLFEHIKRTIGMQLVFPSEVLNNLNPRYANHNLSLESSEQPVPVKKQAKYNINRWALTGRNDLWLNTICYRMYAKAIDLRQDKYWKKICFFWSSDFRTHLTAKRWNDLIEKIGKFIVELSINNEAFHNNQLNLIQKTGYQKYKKISNSQVELVINTSKGCTIKSFKDFSIDKPLMGTLEHGYFDDIEYGVDFFTGHAVIEQLGKHKITDLTSDRFQIKKGKESITIVSGAMDNKIQFENSIVLNKDSVKFFKRISLPNRDKQIIHPFHFTFLPEAWDQQTLYFATHNGGNDLETFYVRDKIINHGENLSFLISSKYGLGNTKGVVIIGDKFKKLVFSCSLEDSFLIPTIFYKKMEDKKFLLRLIYSAQEIDETFKSNKTGYCISASITISSFIA